MPTQPNWKAVVAHTAAMVITQIDPAMEKHGCLPLLEDQKRVLHHILAGCIQGNLQWAGECAGMGVDLREAADPETWSDEPSLKNTGQQICPGCQQAREELQWNLGGENICKFCASYFLKSGKKPEA